MYLQYLIPLTNSKTTLASRLQFLDSINCSKQVRLTIFGELIEIVSEKELIYTY